MRNRERLEEQLERLGREWPSDETFVAAVMSRVDGAPASPVGPPTERSRVMRISSWAAAAVILCAALWWALTPRHPGGTLYAQVREAAQKAHTIHEVGSVVGENGELSTYQEAWFVRGRGFAVISGERTRIDDGEHFWEYNKGSKTASRSKSQGTDELLDKALDIRKELERDCERHPKEDRKIDGVMHQCYRLTFRGRAKPADPSVLNFAHHRTLVFISPEFLVRRVERSERVDGEWRLRSVRVWEYDVEVDPKVFEPDFGDQIQVVDVDELFQRLVAIEGSVHVEERSGLIFAIHRAERFEDGGVAVMSSVRGTEAMLQKHPLKRRMIQPGLYIMDAPATNWRASPQGNGYFRLTLAAAEHKGVHVQWWMMVPRGRKPTWFEDEEGRVKLPIGITPQGAYAEDHKDEHGVTRHVQWEVALDVPRPVTLPTLDEIVSRVHADVAPLEPVFQKYLDLGVEDKGGVPTARLASADEVTPDEFAEAVAEHIRFWQRGDIKLQVERGAKLRFDRKKLSKSSKPPGTGYGPEDDVWLKTPAAFLNYQPLVDDATLARAAKRTDLAILRVRATSVTDNGLVHLKGLDRLEELDVAETAVTDDGLRHLEVLESLRKLDVRDTQVTEAGIRQLKSALPELEVTSDSPQEMD